MSLSTQLALRPRCAATSSPGMSTNSAPPRPPCQLPIPQQTPDSEIDNLRSEIFGKDNLLPPLPTILPSLPFSPHPCLSTLCSQTNLLTFHLTLLNPNLETSTIYTTTNGGYYYTCVLDGGGKIRYSSLAQESVEESLGVVLGLVREDVVVMRWKEEGDKEGERVGEEKDGDSNGEDHEEEGEMEGNGEGHEYEHKEEMGEEEDEGEDMDYEEHDEMDMD